MKKFITTIVFAFFAIFSFSQIDCVVIEWNEDSTDYSVVNFNFTASTLPVVGLQEGLEVLVKRYPYVIPEYDSRLKILGISSSPSSSFDSEYTSTRMWIEQYQLIDRSIAEKIISVSEAENWADYQVFPTQKQLKFIAMALAILDKKASGLTINASEQKILDVVNARALKIHMNHQNAKQKIDSIQAGAEVDLDANWESDEPID